MRRGFHLVFYERPARPLDYQRRQTSHQDVTDLLPNIFLSIKQKAAIRLTKTVEQALDSFRHQAEFPIGDAVARSDSANAVATIGAAMDALGL